MMSKELKHQLQSRDADTGQEMQNKLDCQLKNNAQKIFCVPDLPTI